jgi:hypothetical protein
MRTELVTDALGMAIIRRQPEKRAGDQRTILHSDYAELCVKPRNRVLACAGGGCLTDSSA